MPRIPSLVGTLRRLLLLGIAWSLVPTGAAQDEGITWVPSAKLAATLESTTSITWTDQTLPAGLRSLERAYGVPLVCDRRVDPRRVLTLSIRDQPLVDVVDRAASAVDRQAVVTRWGMHVGPRGIGERMATVAEMRRVELTEQGAAERRRLARESDASWPRLARPATLLSESANEAGITIRNPERVPHDLWDAQSLPPMDFIDRASLILASFDLSFRWVEPGRSIELVPLPETPSFSESYPLGAARREPIETLRSRLTGATLDLQGNRLSVTGSWSAHREARRWIAGETTRAVAGTTRPGEKRLTLTVASASLEQIVDVLERDLELEFVWTEAAAEKKSVRTPVDARDATLEQLLEQILGPQELTFEIDGKTVSIDVR